MAKYGYVEKKMIKVGDTIPSCELTEGTPLARINIQEICQGRKVVIFGVVGAFTPGCSSTHLAGYIARYGELRRKGYDEIVCVTVNDIFVTQAWARERGVDGKIRMLADPECHFTRAMGLEINIPMLGGDKSKRYTMVVNDNVVKQLFVEPDGTGMTCTLADKL